MCCPDGVCAVCSADADTKRVFPFSPGFIMRNSIIWIVPALLFALPCRAAAAELQPPTLRAWETYVQLTEKRIGTELDSSSGFLSSDFMKASEASRLESVLKSGRVYIRKLTTAGADGREIRVPDGLIHHWFGSIFVPDASLQQLLRWVQDYDQHYRYFKEVEQSKLVSKDGDMFKIF